MNIKTHNPAVMLLYMCIFTITDASYSIIVSFYMKTLYYNSFYATVETLYVHCDFPLYYCKIITAYFGEFTAIDSQEFTVK